MSASLGGLLKDYRLQKNLSQLEIAFSLGWKDTSRLSRIEQGRIDKPQRKLIDKICQIMELKREEKNGDSFVTKGDNNNAPDQQKITPEQIQRTGKAILRLPWLGWIKIGFVSLLGM